jgi:anti-sigma regulatory factor (Ser/Thr protein kinase)
MANVLIAAADVTNLAAIRDFVQEWALAQQASPTAVDGLILAVDETASNAIMHGYRGGPGQIEVELAREGEDLVVRVRDDAPAFDPTGVPPPELNVPLEQRIGGGLGIYLARSFVDAYTYTLTPTGRNEVTLRKKIR